MTAPAAFRLAPVAAAVACASVAAAERSDRLSGGGRLDVLLIGQPHGYGGTQAGDCLMLESLSNLRFHVLPVPHDSGDHVAAVDGAAPVPGYDPV